MKKVHAKCDIRDRAKLALTAYQACHQELGESAEEVPGLTSRHPGRYLTPEALPAAPLMARVGRGERVYQLPVNSSS